MLGAGGALLTGTRSLTRCSGPNAGEICQSRQLDLALFVYPSVVVEQSLESRKLFARVEFIEIALTVEGSVARLPCVICKFHHRRGNHPSLLQVKRKVGQILELIDLYFFLCGSPIPRTEMLRVQGLFPTIL